MPREFTVFEVTQQRKEGNRGSSPLTLERVFDWYSEDGRYLPDGSLKTEASLQHVRHATKLCGYRRFAA